MATSKEYMEYLMEQLSELDGVYYRSMMGEYLIYYKDKVAAYICDERFLVRPVPSAIRLLPEAEYDSMIDGGRKKLLRVDDVDNRELLTDLFVSIYEELPEPKARKKKIAFDNNDKRIKYYELLLEGSLDSISEYPLPDGYRFEFYNDGDRDAWIEIEQSAKEFSNYDEGLSAWDRYYSGRENELYNRMVFVVNESGEKIATATAFYDIHEKDKSGAGWLHWVAVKREY